MVPIQSGKLGTGIIYETIVSVTVLITTAYNLEFPFEVADGYEDHAFSGCPEHVTMYHPSFSLDSLAPGPDNAGETAATLAAASMAFRETGE